MATRQDRYRKRKPWVRFVEYARRRCRSPAGSKWWPNYGARGICCRLTVAILAPIWERDNAAAMRKPSLDRVDPAGHYTADNVRFVEHVFNGIRAWKPEAAEVEEIVY